MSAGETGADGLGADGVLATAVVAALRAAPGLAGVAVFDAHAPRAGVPHGIVEAPVLVDWSTKSWTGREGRLAVTLVDGGAVPVRVRALAGAAEAAVLGMAPVLGEGWWLVRVALVRARLVRAGEDRWRASAEFVVRMVREDG